MGLFNSRIDTLEQVLIDYVKKESKSIDEVSMALSTIHTELHKTNTQIAEHLANNKLQLIETKTEILNTVLEKFVEKEDHASDFLQMEKRVLKLTESIDSKVDKGIVKILWLVFSSVAAVIAWFFNKG